MQMVLMRDDVFVSKHGPSYEFFKGQPVMIPKKLVPEAMRFGASPVDETEPETKAVRNEEAEAAKAEADRGPAIEAAVRKMAKRNLSGDFTAGGKPNLNTLAKLVGFTVGADELEAPWAAIKAELASEAA